MKSAIFKTFFLSLCVIANMHLAHAQTASILPPGYTQYLDNNGKPLTSGKVFNYIPATTNFKTTWQDSGQAVANTNPVILNAGGRAKIYGDGNYRQIVKDRLDNIIWDAITSSTGSGSTPTTSTGDGDLVGTMKPWAGINAPNQYMFTYGQEVSRTTYAVLYTAITSTQAAFCNSGSPTLNGLSDTTNFWVGMSLEISCVAAGFTTVISKTSSTVVMAANANITLNTNAVFFPWGRGNGTTTFNLPDFRGLIPAGNNMMGGTASANLNTTYFGATDPNSSGALGGTQSTQLGLTNLPAGIISANAAQSITVNATKNLAGTTGSWTNASEGAGGGATLFAKTDVADVTNVSSMTASNSITVTSNNTGSAGVAVAFSRVQPTRTTNIIIKVTPDTNSATASGVTSLGGMIGDITCGSGILCTGNTISSTLVIPTTIPSSTNVGGWITPQSLGFACAGVAEASIMQTAVDALSATGGVIYLPPGSNCIDSSFVTISKNNVTIMGFARATGNAAPPNVSRLRYTGTNARYIDARSVTGFNLINIELTYSSSSFTGSLIDIGSNNPGVTIGAYGKIQGNFLGTSSSRTGTAAIINMSENVDTIVDQNFFYHAAPAILGQTTLGRNTVAKITKNVFSLNDSVPISSCGESWTIAGNSFEPTSAGTASAFETVIGLPCTGMIWENNWFGDVTVGGGTWVSGFFRGIQFIANKMAGSAGNTTTGVSLNTSTGVVFSANDFDILGNAINCNTAVTGMSVAGNKFGGSSGGTVTTPIANTANCTSLSSDTNSPSISRLASGQINVGQSSADPLPKTVSGDAVLTAAGALNVSSINGVNQTTAWTSYTPTVTCGGGPPTTFSVVGSSYKAIGKTIAITINLVITTIGPCTTPLTLTLPIAPLTNGFLVGGENQSTGKIVKIPLNASSTTTGGLTNYDNTFAPASTTTFILTGVYQSI